MKNYLKYLLLFIIACVVLYTPANAQKKRKKVKQTTSQRKKLKTKKTQKSNSSKSNTAIIVQKNNDNNTDKLVEPYKNTIVQQDTLPEKVITIFSAFKPQLKNLAKIDFVNASDRVDTGTIKLDYQVPSQNLSFQYRPIPLVPRSFKVDSLFLQQKNTSIKFGYGNYFHHFIELNHYFINQNKNTHTFSVNNESITGVHYLQTTRTTNLEYLGDFKVSAKGHLLSKIYYKQSNRYRYGLVPDTLVLPFANYKQNNFVSGASLSWIPSQQFEKRSLQYLPTLSLERFEGIQGATNFNIILNSPFSIDFSNTTHLHFDFTYNVNQFSPKNAHSETNQFLRLDPNIQFNKFESVFKIGVSPILINNTLNMYPDISFKKLLKDTNIAVSAGWNASIVNNGYTNLVAQNPWIGVPNKLEVTTQDHKFIALKMSNGKRVSYGFSLSLNDYTNLVLFNKLYNKNYNYNGLFYNPIFEKKASTIEMDANMRYQFSDHLMILNELKYIQFNSIQENIKPWGILPLEFNSKIMWMPNHKLQINGNAQYWTGATFTNQASVPYDLKNTFVLNAALNYQLTSHFTAWVKGENLLDKPYERWANYPSLGVQFIAGVVYSFK